MLEWFLSFKSKQTLKVVFTLYRDVCPRSFHKGILRKCDHCQTLLTSMHSLTVLPPIAPSPHSCCHNGGPTWQINRNYKMRSGPGDQRSNSQTRHNSYNRTRHHRRFWPFVCYIYHHWQPYFSQPNLNFSLLDIFISLASLHTIKMFNKKIVAHSYSVNDSFFALK